MADDVTQDDLRKISDRVKKLEDSLKKLQTDCDTSENRLGNLDSSGFATMAKVTIAVDGMYSELDPRIKKLEMKTKNMK